jgi:hypothetical protein
MNEIDQAPETKNDLRILFSEEFDRVSLARQKGGSPVSSSDESAYEPVPEEVYKNQCSVIPKKAFNGIDFDRLLSRDFKTHYRQGSTCCVAVLPFNDGCFNKEEMTFENKWEAFILNKKFLRLFDVNLRTGLTSGFGGHASPAGRYFEFLPELLKKDISEGGCSFTMEYTKPADPNDEYDRRQFIENCNTALNNLKIFLGYGPFLRAV